jgi:GMP synthase-like glutamine amidotransferase
MASGHNSFEDVPWINTLVEFTVKVLNQNRIRTIGVCFGHQIVGRAMGIKIGRNPDGWEAAVNDIDLSEKGKQLFGKGKLVCTSIPMLRSHQAHLNF